mmetsp:Transcript_42018/g.70121  ORF Transcript_42018/g.70121 Transcript_42018/m.70121 type:complete len:284 (-) Transcript_42018:1388-2239(-)
MSEAWTSISALVSSSSLILSFRTLRSNSSLRTLSSFFSCSSAIWSNIRSFSSSNSFFSFSLSAAITRISPPVVLVSFLLFSRDLWRSSSSRASSIFFCCIFRSSLILQISRFSIASLLTFSSCFSCSSASSSINFSFSFLKAMISAESFSFSDRISPAPCLGGGGSAFTAELGVVCFSSLSICLVNSPSCSFSRSHSCLTLSRRTLNCSISFSSFSVMISIFRCVIPSFIEAALTSSFLFFSRLSNSSHNSLRSSFSLRSSSAHVERASSKNFFISNSPCFPF